MPRELTLFTDDGQWAAVVTAWEARYFVYHDLGVRVRVYRLGVPDTWGTLRGPWARGGPWLAGPWSARGPWGAWGPGRADGPWAARGPWTRPPLPGGGPWGAVLARSWIETRARSITITIRYLTKDGTRFVSRDVRGEGVSFLRHSESGFGGALEVRDKEGNPIVVDRLESTVEVIVADVPLRGEVATSDDGPRLR